MAHTCIECQHFRGGGDFGLCCSQKYGLTYSYSEACVKFEEGINPYVLYSERGQQWYRQKMKNKIEDYLI